MQINISESWKRLKRRANKMKWSSVISVILLLLMLGSTVTGFLLQAFNFNPQEEKKVGLPSGNIIDYQLTGEQREEMIRQGKTVVEYRYQYVCDTCDAQRSFLAGAIAEYPDQIFVQEILDEGADRPVVEMSSFIRRSIATDPSQEEILQMLCDVMVEPPVRCITSMR
jgi:hypothetical protein